MTRRKAVGTLPYMQRRLVSSLFILLSLVLACGVGADAPPYAPHLPPGVRGGLLPGKPAPPPVQAAPPRLIERRKIIRD